MFTLSWNVNFGFCETAMKAELMLGVNFRHLMRLFCRELVALLFQSWSFDVKRIESTSTRVSLEAIYSALSYHWCWIATADKKFTHLSILKILQFACDEVEIVFELSLVATVERCYVQKREIWECRIAVLCCCEVCILCIVQHKTENNCATSQLMKMNSLARRHIKFTNEQLTWWMLNISSKVSTYSGFWGWKEGWRVIWRYASFLICY